MLMNMVLMYKDVLTFIEEIYFGVIEKCIRDIDFEISIDETSTPTLPCIKFIFLLRGMLSILNDIQPKYRSI